MKIATVIGARPQFVKAAAVSRLLAARPGDRELLIHTGQHYDRGMSAIFFSDLGIPEPACNLGIGSGSHGEQTGRMMIALEPVLLGERPDLLLVYGDTNSTLAGALTAAKLHIPVAHVEAGLRSFNRRMPEEVNRELTDRLSRWLFCPTPAAVRNLADEGIRRGVFHSGDVMLDVHLLFADLAEKRSTVLADQGLRRGEYFLATLHRAENTDSPERLREIFAALGDLGSPVFLPLHPRTRKAVEVLGLKMAPSVRLADPVSYFDMVLLQKNARAVLTDSGGMQKEAWFCRTPCVTLRDETEWTETVEAGWNRLAGADREAILGAVESFERQAPAGTIDAYGDGTSARKIVDILTS